VGNRPALDYTPAGAQEAVPPCSTTSERPWPRSPSAWTRSGGIFDLASKQARLSELDRLTADTALWEDPRRAQELLRERPRLSDTLERWTGLEGDAEDAAVLLELAVEAEDEETAAEAREALAGLERGVRSVELERMFSGPHDLDPCFLAVNAGAGGTDAMDWAEMLVRMYLRYCERKGFSTRLVERTEGEEAGLKSALLSVDGRAAYGHLKAEVGVHRLVRHSPFDANARRHTAFASVFVYPQVDDSIEVEIAEGELRVDTYRASGAGGQHVNKTDSAVRMTHLPTGIVVQCQNERSQHKNRSTAMKVLRARLIALERDRQREEWDAMQADKRAIDFGSQIRSYVLQPYRLVKDLRTDVERGNVDAVLDGELDPFVEAWLLQAADAAGN